MQISANGIALEVEDHGPTSGDPLVLVMGLGMQLVAWHPDFVAMLVARGFRVIRFDNRDCGLSTKLEGVRVDLPAVLAAWEGQGEMPPVPYLLSDMAGDAVAVLDGLDIGQAHIVGASLGGMIVQTMAI